MTSSQERVAMAAIYLGFYVSTLAALVLFLYIEADDFDITEYRTIAQWAVSTGGLGAAALFIKNKLVQK